MVRPLEVNSGVMGIENLALLGIPLEKAPPDWDILRVAVEQILRNNATGVKLVSPIYERVILSMEEFDEFVREQKEKSL